MTAPLPTLRKRGDTRARLLETALQLFAERGYAGTSVRDIADELGITKAAVHYHFSAKEQIVLALLEPLLRSTEELLDRRAAAPPDPRALLLALRDLVREFGPLMSVMVEDPSVSQAAGEVHEQLDALGVRMAEVLAGGGASPVRRLRAHAALGAFFGGWKAAQRLRAGAVTDADVDAVVDAALAALGDED